VSSGKWRLPFVSQLYLGTTDLCPGGPVPSPQLAGLSMENINKKKTENSTKQEPDTLKKSEVATSDDKTSKNTAPKTQVHVTSTPAKTSEQRSRISPIPQKDQSKPSNSVGVANQLLQTEGSAKAGLVVSTRAKEF